MPLAPPAGIGVLIKRLQGAPSPVSSREDSEKCTTGRGASPGPEFKTCSFRNFGK